MRLWLLLRLAHGWRGRLAALFLIRLRLRRRQHELLLSAWMLDRGPADRNAPDRVIADVALIVAVDEIERRSAKVREAGDERGAIGRAVRRQHRTVHARRIIDLPIQ